MWDPYACSNDTIVIIDIIITLSILSNINDMCHSKTSDACMSW